VTVAALLDGRGRESPLLKQLASADVSVHRLIQPARSYVAKLQAIRKARIDVRADVIHSHGYLSDVLVALAMRDRSTPIVTTVHGFTGGSRKNQMYEWLQIRSHRYFDAVVTVSNPIRARLVAAGVRSERIYTVRNAVNPAVELASASEARKALGMPTGGTAIGWVGRVSHEKGLDVLIRAMALLSDSQVRVTVLGDGGERRAVASLAAALGVADRLAWAGVVPEAGGLFRAFDMLVLSSRTEGTPITLLEAMRAGTPIVATAVGGIPDVVSAAEAILVPPDDPAALAAAVRQVLGDRPAAAARAEAAAARLASQFDVASWLQTYEEIYSRVCAAGVTLRNESLPSCVRD